MDEKMMKPTQHTTHSNGNIESLRFLTPEQVRTIREQFGTPVFVYDELSLERQAKAMADFPNAFGLTVFYSLKGGANGAIIRIFDRLGLHFDASSIYEALRAMAAGVAPAKILLTAQEIPQDFGTYVERGMQFNACSVRQLEMYGKQFPGREVSIRVNPGTGTGFINRLVEADQLMPTAIGMAEHLLTLPPASRVNTVHMMRQMRPAPGPDMQRLADALHDHGAKSDLMESRAAFAEKRKPNFKGWKDPADRHRLPSPQSARAKYR